MKLVKADLRRYRSIEEAGAFDIEPDVTCLVGKNESGKTAVLQALYKSYPVDRAPFDEGLDYPSRLSGETRKEKGPIPVSVLTYELDNDEVARVENELGAGALTSTTVVITNGYRHTMQTWAVSVDAAAITTHLRSGLDLPSATDAAASAAMTPAELVAALSAMEVAPAAVTAVISKVGAWTDMDPRDGVVRILRARRPRFVYFGDYDSMPGKVSIPDLITKRDSETLSRGEEAVIALLSLANVELEEFLSPESHEHLVRAGENASNSISREVFTYWTQNKDLAVKLMVIGQAEPTPRTTTDVPPFLQIRVLNKRHDVTVPFDERSRGFVWFFSFLAYFAQLEETSDTPLILLLDEPGLNLHATAQADLLRFIDERLAPSHQVLFSTHSPFMIDAHQFQRVRTVVDDETLGTRVSSDVLRADAETAFPIHAALGIELSQTLFVGPDVLLVEGPGDLVYLEVLSQALKSAGREGLDDKWVITPAGGIAKLPAFVTLLGANKLNTVVLIDSSSKDLVPVQRLRDAGRLGAGGLVELGQVLGAHDADIEDLFEPGFYLELINVAYAGLLAGSKLTVKELPEDARLVRRVERAFEARGINNGRINHFSPAAALSRDQARLIPKINPTTLDRAEALFKEINKFPVR